MRHGIGIAMLHAQSILDLEVESLKDQGPSCELVGGIALSGDPFQRVMVHDDLEVMTMKVMSEFLYKVHHGQVFLMCS
jgi:hypothetical protein